MGEYPPTLPTSWGDLASQSLDPPSSPRQLRLFLSAELFLQRDAASTPLGLKSQELWGQGPSHLYCCCCCCYS